MPDSKITALTAITTVNPATFPLVIVDTSDTSMATTGTTKKVTTNQLLGAGGTATLASATITGDLTVDTNTLKVDSANNRVYIGTTAAVLSEKFNVSSSSADTYALMQQGSGITALFGVNATGAYSGSYTNQPYLFLANNIEQYRISPLGVFTWTDGAGGTRMTLNSTGLGVGTSSIVNAAAGRGNVTIGGSSSAILNLSIGAVDTGYVIHDGTSIYLVNRIAAGSLIFSTNSTERLRIDSSGNVGIGVTPKSWLSSYKAIQLGYSTSLSSTTGTDFAGLSSNAYVDSVDSRWERIVSGYATQYYQNAGDGQHIWRIAGTAAADTAITWTNAMTLDASGNLLVGKTAIGTTVGVEVRPDGYIIATRSASTDAAAFTNAVYSTGASAYRFYVGLGGTVYATNTTISAISDARLKENVQDIDVGLGAILALKPRKFDWKDGKGKNIKGDRGFIAQEFEQVFPQLVDQWADEAPEGEAPYKSVRQDLIPVLVKAIQELTARVQTLETR